MYVVSLGEAEISSIAEYTGLGATEVAGYFTSRFGMAWSVSPRSIPAQLVELGNTLTSLDLERHIANYPASEDLLTSR